ncbi:hypothetical protein [Mucilaginibacter sp. HD30]
MRNTVTKAAIVLLTLIFNVGYKAAAQKDKVVWTAEYESSFYNQLLNDVAPRLPDTNVRKEFVTFMVKRFKEEVPDGLESLPLDSFTALSSKFGKEYGLANQKKVATIVPALTPWTKELEAGLKEAMLKDVKKENYKEMEKLFECTLSQLKKIYPKDVMVPLPPDVLQKAAANCGARVIKP